MCLQAPEAILELKLIQHFAGGAGIGACVAIEADRSHIAVMNMQSDVGSRVADVQFRQRSRECLALRPWRRGCAGGAK
ncbi:MAG: hypothetical protein ABT16_00305 [Rhodanobacter sp. SCN 65-17]|nr:MAG: hypothetical protein ABT16_00305 [Rhodanobacter sp. SCN 65-17]